MVRLRPAASQGLGHNVAAAAIDNQQVIVGPRFPAEFDRYLVASPGLERILHHGRLPNVPPIAAILKGPSPMTLGGIAGTREAKHITRVIAWAQQSCEHRVYRSAAIAVAPTGHDE